MRTHFLRSTVVAAALALAAALPTASRAEAQSILQALGTAGYLMPQEGYLLSLAFQQSFFAGDVLLGPLVAGDMIIVPAEGFETDEAGVCRDVEDDSAVGDTFCSEITTAIRGEFWVQLGDAPISVGPGLRVPSSESVGEIEPYAVIAVGELVFAKASIGAGFQQYEAGIRIGL